MAFYSGRPATAAQPISLRLAGANDRRNVGKIEFLFRHVQIFYHKPAIGKGSYGEVRYATCDKLVCAAKCMHKVFFEDSTVRRDDLIDEFVRECEWMSEMKHPNVTQFLGYYMDPVSRMPVLLMELMDESLTGYLEQRSTSVPFHTTINFCHDVARALDYLHTNQIMHRDLSSNNVLLLGGYRAKVSDFGQSKLADPDSNYRVKDFCPGTQVYMPPEALRNPPEYSSKLDSFSFGVVMLQILTRRFPAPGPDKEKLIRAGPGGTDVTVPVKEVVRRRADIALVDHKHPVLQLALYCLEDDEDYRPMPDELCDRFSELKEMPEYAESELESRVLTGRPAELTVMQHGRVQDQQRALELEEQVKALQLAVNKQDSELMQMRFTLEKKQAEIGMLKESGASLSRGSASYANPGYSAPQPSPSSSVPPVATSYTNPTRLTPQPRSSTSIPPAAQTHPPSLLHSQSTVPASKPTAAPLATNDFRLGDRRYLWYPCSRLPVRLFGGSATMFHNRAFFSGEGLRNVFEYNPERNSWSQLPLAPTTNFTLAVVNGMLTLIGGYTDKNFSNLLYSLMDNRGSKVWLQALPPMHQGRVSPGATADSTVLVVAGGDIQLQQSTFASPTVEVLDLRTQVWMQASKLPKPVKRVKMAFSNDHVFVLGGNSKDNQPLTEVFYCPVATLVKSCTDKSRSSDLQRAFRSVTEPAIWKVASTPFIYSSCTTVGQFLVVVGGWGKDSSDAIYVMNPNTAVSANPWAYVGQLAFARYDCMCCALPGDRLVVVGGRGPAEAEGLQKAEIACPV